MCTDNSENTTDEDTDMTRAEDWPGHWKKEWN